MISQAFVDPIENQRASSSVFKNQLAGPVMGGNCLPNEEDLIIFDG